MGRGRVVSGNELRKLLQTVAKQYCNDMWVLRDNKFVVRRESGEHRLFESEGEYRRSGLKK